MNIAAEVGFGKLRAVLRNRRGAASVEYALLACMIAIAAAIGIAPYGSALAQGFSALSLDHLVGSGSAEGLHGCRRVEWSEAELRRHALKVAAEP